MNTFSITYLFFNKYYLIIRPQILKWDVVVELIKHFFHVIYVNNINKIWISLNQWISNECSNKLDPKDKSTKCLLQNETEKNEIHIAPVNKQFQQPYAMAKSFDINNQFTECYEFLITYFLFNYILFINSKKSKREDFWVCILNIVK